MNSNIFAKVNQIIRACDAAYLGVIDENGYPHVSTVSTIKPEDIFTAYFATGMGANKTKRLLCDKRAKTYLPMILQVIYLPLHRAILLVSCI